MGLLLPRVRVDRPLVIPGGGADGVAAMAFGQVTVVPQQATRCRSSEAMTQLSNPTSYSTLNVRAGVPIIVAGQNGLQQPGAGRGQRGAHRLLQHAKPAPGADRSRGQRAFARRLAARVPWSGSLRRSRTCPRRAPVQPAAIRRTAGAEQQRADEIRGAERDQEQPVGLQQALGRHNARDQRVLPTGSPSISKTLSPASTIATSICYSERCCTRRETANAAATLIISKFGEAGVSLDLLYRNTAIRTRIEHHRSAQPLRQQPGPAALPGRDLSASVVRTLTAQLADLRRGGGAAGRGTRSNGPARPRGRPWW